MKFAPYFGNVFTKSDPQQFSNIQHITIIFYRETVNYPLGRRDRSLEPDGGGGRRRYLEVLLDQVQSKMAGQMEKRKLDDDRMQTHFEHFDGYWGRPGCGAPWEGRGPQKENLMKILHYPTTKVNENLLMSI